MSKRDFFSWSIFPNNFSTKNRRGLSGILTSLIIIGIALAVVGIIWVIISNIITQSSEEIESRSSQLFASCSELGYQRVEVGQDCYGTEIYAEGEKCCNGIVPDQISGLVSWWKFEGNAEDEIGSNDGTIYGANCSADGKVGQSCSFDGIDDYVSITNNVGFNFSSDDFAIETWFYVPNINANQKAIFTGYTDFWLGMFVSGSTMKYFVSSTGSSWNLVCGDCGPLNGIGSTTITENVWHHAVFTRNNSQWKGYIDSSEDLNVVVSGLIPTRSENKVIGRWGNGAYYFNGIIDEVKIFNKSLSADEVKALYLYP